MTRSYYVYYKTPAAPEAVRGAAAEVLRLVGQATRVHGRLLRRCDDPTTWMEVYEDVPDAAAFERALDAAVASSGFARAVAPGGARRIERFAPA